MKSSYKLLFSTAVLCAGLLACQKEFTVDDDLNPTDPPPVLSDSIYLDKITQLFPTGTAGDTVHNIIFRYDNIKRVTTIGDTLTAGSDYVYSTLQYQYTGTDTMPGKRTWIYNQEGLTTDSLVSFFSYDSQKRKVRDSTLRYFYDHINNTIDTSIEIHILSYAAGYIYGQSITYFDNHTQIAEMSRDTVVLNSVGDVSSGKHYVSNSGTYVLSSSSTLTYDNKLNPFSILNVFNTQQTFPDGATFPRLFLSKRNILSEQGEFNGTSSHTYSYSYEYNLLGLVKKILEDYGAGEQATYFYYYRAL